MYKFNKWTTPPVGIIKTMPPEWVKALSRGIEGWEKDFMHRVNTKDDQYWVFNLSGKPRFDVLYFYILFSGAVRYRGNIIGYENIGAIKCYTGEIRKGKIWVQVGGPVIKAKEPVPMQGFQGFRYTAEVIF
jgi:hypothetical protein